MEHAPARAQQHRGTDGPDAAVLTYSPAPGEVIVRLAKLHAETQAAAKVPNGEARPERQLLWERNTTASAASFTAASSARGDERRSPPRHLPLPHAPFPPQPPSQPTARWSRQSRCSRSVPAARHGTPVTPPPAPRHRHRSATAALPGLSQKQKLREAGRKISF